MREEGLDFLGGGLGVEHQHACLIGVEAVDPFEQLEDLEARRPVGHFAEIHFTVAGDEILGVDEAELDVEGADQLLDLGGDLRAVLFQLRRGGHEHRIAERDVFGDVEEGDLAVVHPRFHGEFPAIEVRLHQHREFLVGDAIHLVGRADHPVAQAAGLVEGLEVDGVVGVAVELEQRLVDALEKADHVFLVVGLFEDPHADAAQLGAALHQRLVAQQQGLTIQTRVVEQQGVDGAGPFHGFLEQRNGHVHAHFLEGFGDFHGTVVQALEIPGEVGDVVLLAVLLGPFGCHYHVAPVEIFGRFDSVQAPAEQGDIAFVRVFLHGTSPMADNEVQLLGIVR